MRRKEGRIRTKAGVEREPEANVDEMMGRKQHQEKPVLEHNVGLYRQIATHIYTQAHTSMHKHTLGGGLGSVFMYILC